MQSTRVTRLVAVVIVTLIAMMIRASEQYAHQTETYTAKFHPLVIEQTKDLNISAFFSPDHSAQTLTDLIQNAKKEVIIANPGFSSWSGCTYGKECYGCTAEHIKSSEKFPVFQALVNAINIRNVSVMILTNDPAQYGDKQCEGKMSLLTYLAIAGAKVRYYQSTSFMHAKFISVDDGEWVSISSINYSKTSIMSNREAGVNIYRNKQIADFTRSVFEFDFKLGMDIEVPWNQYSDSDISLIRDKNPLDVTVPPAYDFKYCVARSPAPKYEKISGSGAKVVLTASPDYAYDTLVESLKTATRSVQLSIYEVSSPQLCDLLIDLHSKGVDLKIFVSNDVYGEQEKEEATVCYKKLSAQNILVKMSHPYCLMYSHQKFWIIDEFTLGLSTGNWRPSDYPLPPYVFPPKDDPNFRPANRDFTITVSPVAKGARNHLVTAYQQVFDEDYAQGHAFDPNASKDQNTKAEHAEEERLSY